MVPCSRVAYMIQEKTGESTHWMRRKRVRASMMLHESVQEKCMMSGRRAPELAAGFGSRILHDVLFAKSRGMQEMLNNPTVACACFRPIIWFTMPNDCNLERVHCLLCASLATHINQHI